MNTYRVSLVELIKRLKSTVRYTEEEEEEEEEEEIFR